MYEVQLNLEGSASSLSSWWRSSTVTLVMLDCVVISWTIVAVHESSSSRQQPLETLCFDVAQKQQKLEESRAQQDGSGNRRDLLESRPGARLLKGSISTAAVQIVGREVDVTISGPVDPTSILAIRVTGHLNEVRYLLLITVEGEFKVYKIGRWNEFA